MRLPERPERDAALATFHRTPTPGSLGLACTTALPTGARMKLVWGRGSKRSAAARPPGTRASSSPCANPSGGQLQLRAGTDPTSPCFALRPAPGIFRPARPRRGTGQDPPDHPRRNPRPQRRTAKASARTPATRSSSEAFRPERRTAPGNPRRPQGRGRPPLANAASFP